MFSVRETLWLITGKQALTFLVSPPAKRRPTTQTACHISRSTGTSPPLVQGRPILAEIPRSSATVSDNFKKNINFFILLFLKLFKELRNRDIYSSLSTSLPIFYKQTHPNCSETKYYRDIFVLKLFVQIVPQLFKDLKN